MPGKRVFSLEHRRKLSEALKGKKLSEEHKQKLSKVRKGRKLSEEHKKKLSLYAKNRPEEHERKIRERSIGWKHSKKARQKMSDFWRGRKRGPHSEETKRKISVAQKGRIVSEEIKKRISETLRESYKTGNLREINSEAHKGMKHSKETNCKRSETLKGRIFSEEHKSRISKAKKGVKQSDQARKINIESHNTEEYRRTSSERMSRLIASGKFHPESFGRHGYFFSAKNNDNIYYASSYELDSFQILEQLTKVRSYQRCPFRIAYKTKDGLWHYYVPDILVTYTDGIQEVIEIKPECFVDDEINQAKFEAAKEFCGNKNIDFSVWTEKELNS